LKTSEKIILTIVVIFFIPINILAQKTNIVVNKVKTSEIYIDTDVSEYGNINCINFPTCSKNKKIVMLVHNDFSCCTQTSTELYLIDVNHNLIENKILLIPDENQESFTFQQNEMVVNKVDSFLNCQLYEPMNRISSYTLIKKNQSDSYIEFQQNKIKIKSKEFNYPKITLNGYCCIGFETDKATFCERNPDFFEVYMDSDKQFLLLKLVF